ncbi:MAG: hypothetical protein J5496_02635 [Lachnospiraceae bacterium]|nr:hypothetical protein [Lachnospiraceae bacterium]
MNLPLVWILAGLLFAGLLISLGFQPKFMNKLLGLIFLFVGICGLAFYGYGYYCLDGANLKSVAKTVFWVFCMFLGRNDIGTISKIPVLARNGMQILIYLTHLLALYATASTVITNVGARLIRSLNLLLLHHEKINLIYGVQEESIGFAAQLQQKEKAVTVFVDDGAGSSFNTQILRMGAILMSDDQAKKPSGTFLKKINLRPGKKQCSLYCLSRDAAANLRYAETMKQTLEKAGIRPEQCRVSLLVDDERSGEALLADAGRGGFGSVLSLEKEDLLARLMIHSFPPCDTMRFGRDGAAEENFEALIVGFGRTGQAVLRELIMNGQFSGSRFHALVIAKDYSQQAGYFVSRYSSLLEQIAVDVREDNARSLNVYAYLKQYIRELNYIVICTGNERENAEIAAEYRDFLKQNGGHARLILCSPDTVTAYCDDNGLTERYSIYSPEILDGSHLDEMAKEINHQYHLAEGNSLEDDWKTCDYFSRLSCRASADYLPAFLKAAGLTAEKLQADGWPRNPSLLEHLGEMEHLRWCAFHACMGYRAMPENVFAERAARYRREMEEKGSSRFRAAKDTEKKLHACLIPWQELPVLDRWEKELTGRNVNYQQLDLENVLLIPELLRKRNGKQV